jgi:hypothetical protein
MRNAVVVAVLLALALAASAQTGDKAGSGKRYGIEPDTKKYPQSEPKEALGSVVKALGEKDIRYLMAYLADPAFVDPRVATYMAQMSPKLTEAEKRSLSFEKLVDKTTEDFMSDPTKIKELQRFSMDGEWTSGAVEAVAKLKNAPSRKVFMKKIDDRWVLQDREK